MSWVRAPSATPIYCTKKPANKLAFSFLGCFIFPPWEINASQRTSFCWLYTQAVEPNPTAPPQGAEGDFQFLVTVFAKTTGNLPSLRSLESNERLVKRKAGICRHEKGPGCLAAHWGHPQAYRPARGAEKILTEKNLAGYRKPQGGDEPMFSRTAPTYGWLDGEPYSQPTETLTE